MAKDIIITPNSGNINFYDNGTGPIAAITTSGNNILFSSPSGQIIIEDVKISGSLDVSILDTITDPI